eukprot:c9204_g1_i3.p3 GENE.c9204_g1_i3~~c9204_g1_i3.p3  ORF type:complete len:249 (+),score=53.64 c9204_g1_i3:807-1553(+)
MCSIPGIRLPVSAFHHSAVQLTLIATVVTGIAILSLAPHQEPRFLVPLALPVCLLTSPVFFGRSNRFWKITWLGFNGIVLIFFGGLHQAAVVPSLAYLNSNLKPLVTHDQHTNVSVNIAYHHTYMPPRAFLMIPECSENSGNWCSDRVNVIDWMDEPPQKVYCWFWELEHARENVRILNRLVVPGSIDIPSTIRFNSSVCSMNNESEESIQIEMKVEHQIRPHLSTEHFPHFWNQLVLNIYRVQLTRG